MTFDLLITDAQVVNADGRFRAHVGVTDGVISAVLAAGGSDLPEAVQVIDAAGKIMTPGGGCTLPRCAGDRQIHQPGHV